MIFVLISFGVPLVLYFFLPSILEMFGGRSVSKTPLLVACVLFFISWHLPSPLIEGKQTAFMTHFVGGGVFCGFLWVYLRSVFNLKTNLFLDLVFMYFLTCGLGVTNELFELLMNKIHIGHLDPSDTWWDLAANTLGALGFWIGYGVYKILKK